MIPMCPRCHQIHAEDTKDACIATLHAEVLRLRRLELGAGELRAHLPPPGYRPMPIPQGGIECEVITQTVEREPLADGESPMTKERVKLLQDAADDCEAEANNLLNQAPNMGRTKEQKYREEAEACIQRALALRAWAKELSVEPRARQLDTVGGIEKFAIMRNGLMTTDGPALKPCPMCGHEAGYMESERAGFERDPHRIRVECSNTSCGVMTPRHYATRETAAEAWNRRVENRGVGQS